MSATPPQVGATPPGDRASVTISLAVAPERAFALFTEEIDRWWRRGPRFRNAPGDRGFMRIEPGVGGRVFESFGDGRGERVVEVGRTLAWDPPRLLRFAWRAVNFAPEESTEVEVRFVASGAGTRVTVVHSGWSALRAGHPVRHGLEGAAFSAQMGMWWADLLRPLRELAAQRAPDLPGGAAGGTSSTG